MLTLIPDISSDDNQSLGNFTFWLK